MSSTLKTTDAEVVRASFGRAINNCDLIGVFYDKFLASDPKIGPMFSGTNMQSQKKLLEQSISLAIMFAEGMPLGAQAMRRLGKSHSRQQMNIDPRLYPNWMDSLLAALAEADPEFSHVEKSAWEPVLRSVIAEFTRAY